MRSNLSFAVERYPKLGRTQWLLEQDGDGNYVHFSQNAVLAAAIWHVAAVEKSFRELAAQGNAANPTAMHDYSEKLRRQISDLVDLTRQSQMAVNPRARVMAMITMDVHYRDVFQNFLDNGVTRIDSFAWQSQLRSYFDGVGSGIEIESDDVDATQATTVAIRICDADFGYGYEYLGNSTRLVVTPLTDKIYCTVSQSLQLNMGCSLSGWSSRCVSWHSRAVSINLLTFFFSSS